MSSQSELSGAASSGEKPDLTACDREPIHIPGSIQPHGLLLIADAATMKVVGGAGDIEERLTPAWLGRPLRELLAQDIAPAAAQAAIFTGTAQPLARVPAHNGGLEASLFRSGDYLLAELEPLPEASLSAGAILARLDAIGTGFERASDLQALCERAAIGFRELTGFDRVMIYRFLDDAAGVVMAEDRDPALQSFLNHHFPATDIPRQARALYVRNRVRVIPDIGYSPAPIRPAEAALAGIDLSDSILRSVSPIHLHYLRNMGVGASASISIVKDGLLWGMVACHHSRPRGLSFEQRAACRALAGGLARQIRAKEEAETYRERIRLRHAEDAVIGNVDPERPFDLFFTDRGDEIRRMLDGDGFAVVGPDGIVSTGVVPPDDAIRALARWAAPLASNEALAVSALAEGFPPAEAYREQASGLLTVTLPSEVPTQLMWFRAEQPETVEWAGNPHKNSSADPGEQLTPRNSFEAWRETVRGRARGWTLAEVEAANRFRRALFQLRQSRRLRELNRELSATIADREALLSEKDHLLREGNHRVQNSLQLVQAFLGLQAREGASPEVVAHLGEAQRRLAAVALVHRRLYQADHVEAVDLGRYLEELTRDMMSSMGAEWQNQVRTDLAPLLVPATRAVNIGLILTELVINANKYAYGGGAGPISIALEPYRNQFRLIVADEGKGSGPSQSAGSAEPREGFGTRMMQAMVQRLGGTIERFDNHPGLRVILTAPVEE